MTLTINQKPVGADNIIKRTYNMANVEEMRTLGTQVYFKIWNDNKLEYEHLGIVRMWRKF